MIVNIKSEIQCLRGEIGIEFHSWYDEAKQLASYIGIKEEMPRVIGRMYILSQHIQSTYYIGVSALLTHLFFITIDQLVFPLL